MQHLWNADYTTVDENAPDVLPQGLYDVTITGWKPRFVGKNLYPVLEVQGTIDNGEQAGKLLNMELWFTHQSAERSQKHLKRIFIGAGHPDYNPENVHTLEDFAAQFPVNQWRNSWPIEHEYSIKTKSGEWKNRVSENDYKRQIEAGGEGNVRARVNPYGIEAPKGEKKLDLVTRQSFAKGGDGAPAQKQLNPDADLPF